MKRPLAATVAALSACATLLAGCGSNSLSSGGSTGGQPSGSALPAVQASQELNAALPDAIRQAGVIEVGADPTYKPNEYMDGTTIVGMNVELLDAVAQPVEDEGLLGLGQAELPRRTRVLQRGQR